MNLVPFYIIRISFCLQHEYKNICQSLKFSNNFLHYCIVDNYASKSWQVQKEQFSVNNLKKILILNIFVLH